MNLRFQGVAAEQCRQVNMAADLNFNRHCSKWNSYKWFKERLEITYFRTFKNLKERCRIRHPLDMARKDMGNRVPDGSTDRLMGCGICLYFAATGCITHFKMITTIADAFNDDQTKVLDEFLFRSVSNSFVHIYG